MDPPDTRGPRQRSELLREASRALVERTKVQLTTTRQRLDAARNALQLCWLLRVLRERHRK
jgi:hypothetical protein